MRPRTLVLVPLLLAAVLLSTASTAPDVRATPSPTDLPSLGVALDLLTRRLEGLTKYATTDPRWADVQAYLRYKDAEDFNDRKRPATALDLHKIWSDPKAETALRKAAWDALTGPNARLYEPDFSAVKKGSQKPRNKFAIEHVTDLLVSPDRVNRELADRFLKGMFTKPSNEPAIDRYDAAKSSERDQKEARQAWNKHLRR